MWWQFIKLVLTHSWTNTGHGSPALQKIDLGNSALHENIVDWKMRLIPCSFLSSGILCLDSRSSRCEPATLHTGDIFKPPLRAGCRLCADCGRKWSLQKAAESYVSAGGAQPLLLSSPGTDAILSGHGPPDRALRTLGKGKPACWVENGFRVIILRMIFDILLSLLQHWSPRTPTQGQHHSKDCPLQEWPKAGPS